MVFNYTITPIQLIQQQLSVLNFLLISKNPVIEIYNLKGQKIKTFHVILSGVEGQTSVVWNGTDENNQPVSSGIYFYKFKAGKFEETRKMLLLK